jgi:hypothetical protein
VPSAVLWLVLAAAFVVLPVALRFLAEEGPDNDEPPDTGGDGPRLPLLLTA